MIRESWSDRDERQYRRIRRTELGLGKSEELAEEIAWRTVQLQRMARGLPAGGARGAERLPTSGP